MNKTEIKRLIKNVLDNMPSDWLRLTTHRLDIYNEELAKTEFLEQFENKKDLKDLPTAFDYIRLGHPLSCILEWAIAKTKDLHFDNIVSFSSQTMPILAILRKNLIENRETQIVYKKELPASFDADILKSVYNYKFDLVKFDQTALSFDGTTILLTDFDDVWSEDLNSKADFEIGIHPEIGSVVIASEKGAAHISEIQHVRRRESIAMTPQDCLSVLELFSQDVSIKRSSANIGGPTVDAINSVANTQGQAVIGSCGLSVQYAIMMGLTHHTLDKYKGREIKFIVPPNCYGGTNDQARRVAACIENVEVMDLPVDRGQDMVQSVERVLEEVASLDAVPFIIAEIPTNPRVEVPDLDKLKTALSKKRKTKSGDDAVSPVFILDQTFCPNVNFLGEGDILSDVETIAYVSGSKFPSGGLCTAGYCVGNKKAEKYISYVDRHLKLCGNEATAFQVETLLKQMPSMIERIDKAYRNTREFVEHIQKTLPEAKINFVSKELAQAGFTPSVFSLDLPTKGGSHEQRESFKRELNHKLITLMIEKIPADSKHCVSYGQLQGCYWTIPATSTQGTTKEGDKDYIVRVSMSPELDLELHKEVFSGFCEEYIK